MFKVFSILFVCALANAAPDEIAVLPSAPLAAALPLYKSTLVAEPTHVEVHEPALAKVGELVESVPTAVSHQSSTVVHSKAQRITPIVTPAVRSYAAPAIQTFAPFLQHAPLLRTLPFGLGPAAAFVHANAPVQVRSFAAAAPLPAPVYRSYGFTAYGHPLVYASTDFKK
ncbi:uncharacterized protein LOC105214425 [Zeugodacus cucurbitae]|uniref:Homeobox-leucine zipper protein ATHB-17 n=1 Tax=Zeugodacus cucurbitae TaxID=28588 RepID=A0A0A1WN43_ZEUCU|nr:uncharacterized protein LOC105214425 [Zeugodacus cucurbitae]